MNDLPTRALIFATAAHASIDHRRKYTNDPYIVHPLAVARLVQSVGGSPDMIAAAYLHDVVEDTPITLDEIVQAFGLEVGSLVEQLTDVSKPSDGNRAVRKEIDRQHSARATPDGQTIKLADLIDNSRTITTYDPGFAVRYMREKRALLDLMTQGHPQLLVQAWSIVHAWEAAKPCRS